MRPVVLILPLLLPVALGSCGSAAQLQPRPGESLPVAPYGARATPTPKQLLTPTTQQRPQRLDDYNSSQERRSNEFDLPPS